jgi:geranylgeranyl diphosphate synthase type II
MMARPERDAPLVDPAFRLEGAAARQWEGWIKERRTLLEEALRRFLPAPERWPLRLHEAMAYSLHGGGKRLRPLLALASWEAALGPRDQDWNAVLPAACAVEMVHAYSLIHDDLPAMDDSPTRRGLPSSHVKFGEALAILAGDALLTEAFRLVLDGDACGPTLPPERRLALGLLLSECAGLRGMVGGQSLDMGFEGRTDDEATLTFLHRRKTGDLIRCAVEAGALVAGAGPERLAVLRDYAAAFGLAFQVRDDVLDATQDQGLGGRSESETPSFVHVLGLERARGYAQELLERGLAAVESLDERADPLRGLLWVAVHRES